MTRKFLPLTVAAALLTTGAPHAFSQTTGELLDRVQKDLQTRIKETKAESGSADPARAQFASPEAPALQGLLSELQQTRRFFASGNDEAGAQLLSQLENQGELSAETKAAIEAVIQQAHKERADRDAAFAQEVDAACRRAADAVTRAAVPRDLDAALGELARLRESQTADRYENGGNNRAAMRLQSAVSFVNHWQDYLLAHTRHNDTAAASALHNLTGNDREGLLVPRSYILSLLPTTTDQDGESSESSQPPRRPVGQIEADAVATVQGVKTLDEMPAALTKLLALRKELSSAASSGRYNSESDLGAAISGLQALQKTAFELQNGLATSLSVNTDRTGYNQQHPEIENVLMPLRLQLLKLAAPRILGSSTDVTSAADEPLDAFVRRLIDAAKKRQDWGAVVRGLELKHTLVITTNPSVGYNASAEQDVSAFKNFFAGRNLEQAGQFEQAVMSYLTALRSGQEDLPNGYIGERLAEIKKAHPTEYASASAYMLNPAPAMPYGYSRFGQGGVLFPGANDPRFQGRPGFPRDPRSGPGESVAIPAASPPAVSPATNP